MPDFVDTLSQQQQLTPVEVAILRSAGVRSVQDVDSLVRNFPSLHTVGMRIALLSAAVMPRLSVPFAALATSIAAVRAQRHLSRGAVHPPGARWARGMSVPMPPLAAAIAQAAAPAGLAGAIDLRVASWPVRNQGQRGTCVAFASTACAEIRRYVVSPSGPTGLSEQFLYWAIKTKTADPNPNTDGTWLQFARDALAADGICPESLWPYVGPPIPGNVSQAGGGNPSAAAIAAGAANTYVSGNYQVFNTPGGGASALLNALQNGKPVAITVPVFSDPTVPNGADNWSTGSAWSYGRILNPPATAVASDGHAVCVVGYQPDPSEPNGGYFIFRNSWDVAWAYTAPSPGNSYSPQPGYGDISATYIEDYIGNCCNYKSHPPLRERLGRN